MDTTGQWWADLLAGGATLTSSGTTLNSVLRANYEDWCRDNGAMQMGIKSFSSYLKGRGLTEGGHTNQGKVWRGLEMVILV